MYVLDLGCVFTPKHVCVFIGVIIAIVLCKKADVTVLTFFSSIFLYPVCSTRVLGVSPFFASSI